MNNKNSSGYALLFAVLVASILLSAGLGIANIIYKELQLSSIGRESTKAFYYADSGAECAIYWNGKLKFPTVSALRVGSWSNPPGVKCADTPDIYSSYGGSAPPLADDPNDSTKKQAIVSFDVSQSTYGCAKVKVIKLENGTTYIESRGFNVDCASSGVNLRRVERAVRYRIN
ncbi:MAG: hypothetical protein HZA95_01610 [Candidatus Vogelbacteria bacterium]|nr:hypothetical protein [Candidatus Vogelbacteria bacterium]